MGCRSEERRVGKECWPGEEEGAQGERASLPVINSVCDLHSLDPSERFMPLHRKEEEEGDRGDQDKERGNQKERDISSQ